MPDEGLDAGKDALSVLLSFCDGAKQPDRLAGVREQLQHLAAGSIPVDARPAAVKTVVQALNREIGLGLNGVSASGEQMKIRFLTEDSRNNAEPLLVALSEIAGVGFHLDVNGPVTKRTQGTGIDGAAGPGVAL